MQSCMLLCPWFPAQFIPMSNGTGREPGNESTSFVRCSSHSRLVPETFSHCCGVGTIGYLGHHHQRAEVQEVMEGGRKVPLVAPGPSLPWKRMEVVELPVYSLPANQHPQQQQLLVPPFCKKVIFRHKKPIFWSERQQYERETRFERSHAHVAWM